MVDKAQTVYAFFVQGFNNRFSRGLFAFLVLFLIAQIACNQSHQSEQFQQPIKSPIIKKSLPQERKNPLSKNTLDETKIPAFSPIKIFQETLFARWLDSTPSEPSMYAIFNPSGSFDIYNTASSSPVNRLSLPRPLSQNIFSAAPTTQQSLWMFGIVKQEEKSRFSIVTSSTEVVYPKKRKFTFKQIGTINDSRPIDYLNTVNHPSTVLTHYQDGSAKAWFLQPVGDKGEKLYPAEGLKEKTIQLQKTVVLSFSYPILSVQLDPDKNRGLVLTTGGSAILLQTTTEPSVLHEWSGSQRPIWSASLLQSNPNGLLLLGSNEVSVIDIDTQQVLSSFPLSLKNPITSPMSAYQIGDHLIAFHNATIGIMLWDTQENKFVGVSPEIKGHISSITCNQSHTHCLASDAQNKQTYLFELPKAP